MNGVIEEDDALLWLPRQKHHSAKIVVFDPPYAVGTPVRGREDGAAGSVYGPLSFMSRTLAMCTRVLRTGGIVMIYTDWRRLADMGYIASTVGLRPAACVAWTRTTPGTGGLFRSAWDPILIVARGTASALDRAAIPNVVQANYPGKRRHPYEKPLETYRHVFKRVLRPDDLVLDPFAGIAGSRAVALELGARWAGCDIDPDYAEQPASEKFDVMLDEPHA